VTRRDQRWPNPADSALDRARTIATEYRDALHDVAPHLAGQLDREAAARGQGWVAPSMVTWGDDDLITAEQAAELCHVQIKTLFEWRRRGLPHHPTPDGTRYLVRELLEYEGQRRRRRTGQHE